MSVQAVRSLNANAIRRNINASININKNINKLRAQLQEVSRKRKVRSAPSKVSPQKPSTETGSMLASFLYSLFVLSLLIFIFAFIYHFFVQTKVQEISDTIVDRTRDIIDDRIKSAPKGVSDMPTQLGAPVSTEGPPDDTENAYLTLYGSPDAPGFSDFPGGEAPGYRNYTAWGQGYNDGAYPFPGGPSFGSSWDWRRRRWTRYRQARLGDYYLKAEMANVPRDQLNQYVQEQNRYVRRVNDRVRRINKERMYSPRYLRHEAELKELRNFERRLANKVHDEYQDQPVLPDRYY